MACFLSYFLHGVRCALALIIALAAYAPAAACPLQEIKARHVADAGEDETECDAAGQQCDGEFAAQGHDALGALKGLGGKHNFRAAQHPTAQVKPEAIERNVGEGIADPGGGGSHDTVTPQQRCTRDAQNDLKAKKGQKPRKNADRQSSSQVIGAGMEPDEAIVAIA